MSRNGNKDKFVEIIASQYMSVEVVNWLLFISLFSGWTIALLIRLDHCCPHLLGCGSSKVANVRIFNKGKKFNFNFPF